MELIEKDLETGSTCNKKVRVSVIIPVYNREKYIAQALDSVLAQSYENYEIIAVDDGSTDSSLKILNNYQERFPGKVRVLQQINSGPSAARNNAIMSAIGEYISFLDSDDLWAPQKLEKQLCLFEKHQDVAFVYSGYCLIDEGGAMLEERYPLPEVCGNIEDKLWSMFTNISGGTLLVEKDKLIHVGLFDTNLGSCENHDLRIRLSGLGNVYYCKDILYYYRIHKDSLTASLENEDTFDVILLEKYFGKNGINNKKQWNLIRSRQLYFQGGNFLQRDDFKKAVVSFFNSILLNPKRPRAYINLLRCFMGTTINSWLVSLKR